MLFHYVQQFIYFFPKKKTHSICYKIELFVNSINDYEDFLEWSLSSVVVNISFYFCKQLNVRTREQECAQKQGTKQKYELN